MRYHIIHTTLYTYSDPVSLCQNIALLTPRGTPEQQCVAFQLQVLPVPHTEMAYEDVFGNRLVYFSIEQEHGRLSVIADSLVDIRPFPEAKRLSSLVNLDWETVVHQVKNSDVSIVQFCYPTKITEANAAIESYARESFTAGRCCAEAVVDLMHRIFADFHFKPGFTTIATPPAEVMAARAGVCQDFAHLALACLRSLGLAARYVSGYIETIAPPGGEKLVGSDASHAWFSVYLPGNGWVDFDPTNNQLPSGQHITIGWGRDYFDVVPLKGVMLGSGEHTLKVEVDVKRLPVSAGDAMPEEP